MAENRSRRISRREFIHTSASGATALLGSGDTPLRVALNAAGFVSTPRGLRLRA